MSPANLYYFDNNATTPVAPEVVEAMLPFLTEKWANASSPYRIGREVAKHIETARERVAALINADPEEVVFTSGGTESINAAVQSALLVEPRKRHVVTTAVEHSATLRFCESLEKRGYEVTVLPVGTDGLLDASLLEQAIRPDTAIVSIMWANNETGVVFPVKEIADICRQKAVPFHTDAVQTPGKIALDVQTVGVDLLSLSAHKLYAPKGVGALYIRRGTKYWPYVIGGQQEDGRRGGTESVANIIGFGVAASLAHSKVDDVTRRVGAMRDRLENTILNTIPNTRRNGAEAPRLPNTSNISFGSIEAEGMIVMLDNIGVCVSSGSACTTGSLAPSHVLTAMGINADRARASLRFSLGLYTTEADVDYLVANLPGIISRLSAP
ncbi:MAG: Cysteine desulfurase [Verrucomicrobia bacterium ADurb.Bin118]|jgi:cysteine desulfurase|nr:MAG: Cysteine desulfurase [Verrucomicrobia bacterium ADurb.Bin118]